MSKKKELSLVTMAMAMFGVGDNQVRERKGKLPSRKPLIPNGHKKFVMDGNVIYALNEANARKKFHKEFLYYPADVEIIG